MARLTGFRSYTKGRVLELGKVLRSKNRKKHFQNWIAHIRTDATKHLPDEWQRLLKNPRQEVRRLWMKKARGKQVHRVKASRATPAKAASENRDATK